MSRLIKPEKYGYGYGYGDGDGSGYGDGTATAAATATNNNIIGGIDFPPTPDNTITGVNMSKETGGEAFPLAKGNYFQGGMTLRDYFAANAMNGFLSNEYESKELSSQGNDLVHDLDTIAELSYAMTDAMLKARDK